MKFISLEKVLKNRSKFGFFRWYELTDGNGSSLCSIFPWPIYGQVPFQPWYWFLTQVATFFIMQSDSVQPFIGRIRFIIDTIKSRKCKPCSNLIVTTNALTEKSFCLSVLFSKLVGSCNWRHVMITLKTFMSPLGTSTRRTIHSVSK